jgi:hypothetical protein
VVKKRTRRLLSTLFDGMGVVPNLHIHVCVYVYSATRMPRLSTIYTMHSARSICAHQVRESHRTPQTVHVSEGRHCLHVLYQSGTPRHHPSDRYQDTYALPSRRPSVPPVRIGKRLISLRWSNVGEITRLPWSRGRKTGDQW